jgi:hypothetical protein
MKKILNSKTSFILVSLVTIIIILSANVNAICSNNSPINKTQNTQSSDLINCDLKIRKSGGNWQDTSISAKKGETLEFKAIFTLNKDYKELIISFLLSDEDTKIFNYVELSASPVPNLDEGFVIGMNDAVLWIWKNVNSDWDKEMTFKVKIKEKGKINVLLNVIGIIDENGEESDEGEDTVLVEGTSNGAKQREKSFNFIIFNKLLSRIIKKFLYLQRLKINKEL